MRTALTDLAPTALDLLGLSGDAKVKMHPRLGESLRGAFFARRYDLSAMIARGFYETGLRPANPQNLSSPRAHSFFGETTRGNGT